MKFGIGVWTGGSAEGVWKLLSAFGVGLIGVDPLGPLKRPRLGEIVISWINSEAVQWPTLFHSVHRPAPPVFVGARFCAADAPRIVWQIHLQFIGLDDVPYANLFCVADPTLRKVVAQSALQDSTLYTPVS